MSAEPSVGGTLRTVPEDFRVEEIPLYAPSGEGDHLYVTFEKRLLTTPDAVSLLAKALRADLRQAGWAGLKDKEAVTVQTASFLAVKSDAAEALLRDGGISGVRVLSMKKHRNKLKTGHLAGNRFELRIRGCVKDSLEIAQKTTKQLLSVGVPNYYGAQRFGREGDNAERGRAWLKGGPAPKDRFLRKMFASAVQSELFNRVVAERVREGILHKYVAGDLAVRHPSDRVFLISPEEAAETYASGACSATGPMFGPSMRWPEGEAKVREEAVLRASELTMQDFSRAGDLAEGTRRAVRVVLSELTVERCASESAGDTEDLLLRFALPAGGYATAVLREFRKSDEEGLPSLASFGIEQNASDAEASNQ